MRQTHSVLDRVAQRHNLPGKQQRQNQEYGGVQPLAHRYVVQSSVLSWTGAALFTPLSVYGVLYLSSVSLLNVRQMLATLKNEQKPRPLATVVVAEEPMRYRSSMVVLVWIKLRLPSVSRTLTHTV